MRSLARDDNISPSLHIIADDGSEVQQQQSDERLKAVVPMTATLIV
jgi:hypothetical protein